MECFKCKKGIEEQYNVCCNCFDKEINELKDKLHRRNMQIKDLKIIKTHFELIKHTLNNNRHLGNEVIAFIRKIANR